MTVELKNTMYNITDNLPPIHPCRVFDANGKEVVSPVAFNPITGVVLEHRLVNGFLIADPETESLIKDFTLYPAPLYIEAIPEGWKSPAQRFKHLGCTCPGPFTSIQCPACSRVRELRRMRQLLKQQAPTEGMSDDVIMHHFTMWANDNGVSMEHHEDYDPWLGCFTAGVREAERAIK